MSGYGMNCAQHRGDRERRSGCVVQWCSGAEHRGDRITAWFVYGACAFTGCAAGILSKPEHVVQFLGFATTAQ
jgi:hypothetical protein